VPVVGAVDGGGRTAAQSDGVLIVSSIRVTAMFLASARPSMVTPAPTVIEARAMMVPAKTGPLIVAEVATCQKTLQPCSSRGAGSLTKTTELITSVVSAVPTLKIQTASGSPCAFRVSWPLTSSDDEAV
jgi:hypothetical protein